MRDLPSESQRTGEETSAIQNEAANTTKKKSIDEMIEEFKKANPTKNPRKIYRGVF